MKRRTIRSIFRKYGQSNPQFWKEVSIIIHRIGRRINVNCFSVLAQTDIRTHSGMYVRWSYGLVDDEECFKFINPAI